MRNNDTYVIAKPICLLFFLSFFSFVSHAQEYIKEICNLQGDTTLIRDYLEEKRMLCCNDRDSITFVMISDPGTSAPYISIKERMYVFDMEEFRDTLFFCGRIEHSRRISGYIGFFDLSTFPSSIVHLYLFPETFCCKKLEVMRSCYGGTVHVFATAVNQDESSCLIDGVKSTPYGWSFFKSFEQDDDQKIYDDVASTELHVVMTVRHTQDSTGYVYTFNHPTPGNHIFYGLYNEIPVYDDVMSKILVSNCTLDSFITVCKVKYPPLPTPPYYCNIFDLVGFNGSFASVRFQYPSEDISGSVTNKIVDINTHRHYKESELLIQSDFITGNNSMIYHIDDYGGNTGRIYYDQQIHSLDYLQDDPYYYYTCSGFSSKKNLWFYRYNPFLWKRCSEKIYIRPNTVLPKDIINQKEIFFISPRVDILSPVHNIGWKNIDIKCFDDMDEE